eukprot:TRINITY_DN18990_c0_g1_i1.p1 TRINITY_DN18990_c0_g1~~TRINITY_DN18990_c0_g1_i1.p1  ORF type:complete len:710 (-),score=93.87 TRINITY_DN18990_c0_g1_i1:72-1976(-)
MMSGTKQLAALRFDLHSNVHQLNSTVRKSRQAVTEDVGWPKIAGNDVVHGTSELDARTSARKSEAFDLHDHASWSTAVDRSRPQFVPKAFQAVSPSSVPHTLDRFHVVVESTLSHGLPSAASVVVNETVQGVLPTVDTASVAPRRQRARAANSPEPLAVVAVGRTGSFAHVRGNRRLRNAADKKTVSPVGRGGEEVPARDIVFMRAATANSPLAGLSFPAALGSNHGHASHVAGISRAANATAARESRGGPSALALFFRPPWRGGLRLPFPIVASSLGSAFSTAGLLSMKKFHVSSWEDLCQGGAFASLSKQGEKEWGFHSLGNWQVLGVIFWCLGTATWMLTLQTLMQQVSLCFRCIDVILSIEAARWFFGERTSSSTQRGSQLLVCSCIWSLIFVPKVIRHLSMEHLFEHCLRTNCFISHGVLLLFLLCLGIRELFHHHRSESSKSLLQCITASAVLAWYTRAAFAGMLTVISSDSIVFRGCVFAVFVSVFMLAFLLHLYFLNASLEKAALAVVFPFFEAVTLVLQMFFQVTVFIQSSSSLDEHIGFWFGVVALLTSVWMLIQAGLMEEEYVRKPTGLVHGDIHLDQVWSGNAFVGSLVLIKDPTKLSWLGCCDSKDENAGKGSLVRTGRDG